MFWQLTIKIIFVSDAKAKTRNNNKKHFSLILTYLIQTQNFTHQAQVDMDVCQLSHTPVLLLKINKLMHSNKIEYIRVGDAKQHKQKQKQSFLMYYTYKSLIYIDFICCGYLRFLEVSLLNTICYQKEQSLSHEKDVHAVKDAFWSRWKKSQLHKQYDCLTQATHGQ